MSYTFLFGVADIKQSRESNYEWALSQPPVSSKENMLPIAQQKFSSHLKKMFNFINALPEFRAALASVSKDIICIPILGTQQFVPQISSFVWIKQSANPFSH
jgi:hypothetical protein